MTDEYTETQNERKSIASSARAEARATGMRKDLVPTKAEYDSKCGEVVTYNYNKPMRWKQFKMWDFQHRKEYIETLVKKYRPSCKRLALMFGVSDKTVSNELQLLGIALKTSFGSYNPRNIEWEAFANQMEEQTGQKDEGETMPKNELTPSTQPLFTVLINSGTISAEGDVSEILPQMVSYLINNAPADCRIAITWEKL